MATYFKLQLGARRKSAVNQERNRGAATSNQRAIQTTDYNLSQETRGARLLRQVDGRYHEDV